MKNTSLIIKTLALILALAITLAFAGCGDDVMVADGNTASFYPEPSNIATPSSSEPSWVIPTTSSPPTVTSPPPIENHNIFDQGSEELLLDEVRNLYGRNKSVHILMWREFTDYEESVIKDFENSTGVKVLTTVTSEETYKSKLISLISQNNAPDIAMFSSKDFPGLPLNTFKPLNDSLSNYVYSKCLEANCWNGDYVNAFEINGNHFGVSMSGSWLCEDMNYVTYYNTKILNECGCNSDPFNLYKEGKWNWETQREIFKKIANYNIQNGANYTPYMTYYYDVFMLSAGKDFASINRLQTPYRCENKPENTVGHNLVQAWSHINKLYSDKLVEKYDSKKVYNFDKVALYTGRVYSSFKHSAEFDVTQSKNIGAVPVAGQKGGVEYNPVKPRAYGTPLKAKEPALGIMFIRYLLAMTTSSSMAKKVNAKSVFLNDKIETTYKCIMSGSHRIKISNAGILDFLLVGNYDRWCTDLTTKTNESVESILKARKNTNKSIINRINKKFQQIKAN